MTLELNFLEELDILFELQYPNYVFTMDNLDEKIAFSKYISSLSNKRMVILNDAIYEELSFAVAGLKEGHIETILKDGPHATKRTIFSIFSNPEFLKQVIDFITELDRRGKTTENSARFQNIMQYLKDNKYIV